MYLGNLRIAEEEIQRIAWEDGELTFDVRWALEEVPPLLDLPRETLLRWHEDAPQAGIPVKLRRWRLCPDKRLRLVVIERGSTCHSGTRDNCDLVV